MGSVAREVEARAAELLGDDQQPDVSDELVKTCLDLNERGDGILYATLHRNIVRYDATPDKGRWYKWNGVIWEDDLKRSTLDIVEECALYYHGMADRIAKDIDWVALRSRKHPAYWDNKPLEILHKKYTGRAARLRKGSGARAARDWAAIVDQDITCESSDFDRHPWLLPVANGVIDLKAGVLVDGRPEDMLSRQLDIEYDPAADYSLWEQVLLEITGSEEVAGFLKRTFGYAITGLTTEQRYWVFIGPGRNGKGIIFNMLGDIMGPYYHEINRGMILEQRNEPSPSAASEHLRSLLGKRIIVGSETNKYQSIDGGAVKRLTGEDKITCRPNFEAEISFTPTHTLFLHTNHIPRGLTRDFALLQRLLLVEFPYMFVDDIEAEAKKTPSRKHLFRQKDPELKNKLSACRQGILRWLVEGCLEWQERGLDVPKSVMDGVAATAKEEDHFGEFIKDCLAVAHDDTTRISAQAAHDALKWWWAQNMDTRKKRCPALRTLTKELRERDFIVDKVGGKTWLYGYVINTEVAEDVTKFARREAGV